MREDVDLQVNAEHALRFGAGLSRFTFDLYNVLGSSNQPLKVGALGEHTAKGFPQINVCFEIID